MKTDNKYFMAAVSLRTATDHINKALDNMENNLNGTDWVHAAMEDLISALRELHKRK